MGPDLLTASFAENELRKKYKNFYVPAAKILVGDGKANIAENHKVQVESIQVSLNLEDAASASFNITGIYDLQSHSVKSSIKDAVCLGTLVEVQLGYDSELVTVFSGFIYEISMQFSEVPSMHVTAMDVKRLMSDNYRENYNWDKKKYSEIFKEIMNDYNKLNAGLKVDDTAEIAEKVITQRGTDLQMVRYMCKEADRKFIVCGGKSYFVKKDDSGSITTLLWGQDLLSLSQRASYVDVKIEVIGNKIGEVESETVKKTVTSKTIKKVRDKGTTRVVVMPNVRTLDELKVRANEEEESIMERMMSGSGSCVGLPVLIPGRYIKIKGLDKEIDGEYYLKAVSHNYGGDGYTTDFTLGGKK